MGTEETQKCVICKEKPVRKRKGSVTCGGALCVRRNRALTPSYKARNKKKRPVEKHLDVMPAQPEPKVEPVQLGSYYSQLEAQSRRPAWMAAVDERKAEMPIAEWRLQC